jgi:fused signal recognition particle receptor
MFGRLFGKTNKTKEPTKEELEEYLIECDIDYEIVENILNKLSNKPKKQKIKEKLLDILNINVGNNDNNNEFILDKKTNFVVNLFFGINGAGKTTTIAKIANLYKTNGHKVLLGAGDTFRAGAITQLDMWANKLGVDIVKTKMGHDPSAVAYDTITKAKAKNFDRVLLDTSGRLQTQESLMRELQKISKVCDKAMGADKLSKIIKIMILDGMSGQSSLKSASAYLKSINIDGAIVSKLDGSAKGGVIFSIYKELKIPILYIGVGEKQEDIQKFDKTKFVDELLDGIYN